MRICSASRRIEIASGARCMSDAKRLMDSAERIRSGLGAAVEGPGDAIAMADRLCGACVDLLNVDGAAVSIVNDGASRGTFGSSSELSRLLDELQFTFGEGPCLDAVRANCPVLVADLNDATHKRWPAFSGAVQESGVCAVFAFPVIVAGMRFGALDLLRLSAGSLIDEEYDGALRAAELAVLPVLRLLDSEVDWSAAAEGADGWSELASLERVEVYQATGMVMHQLDVGAPEALVRIRAYAFSRSLTASEVAWQIVERRVTFKHDREPGRDR